MYKTTNRKHNEEWMPHNILFCNNFQSQVEDKVLSIFLFLLFLFSSSTIAFQIANKFQLAILCGENTAIKENKIIS